MNIYTTYGLWNRCRLKIWFYCWNYSSLVQCEGCARFTLPGMFKRGGMHDNLANIRPVLPCLWFRRSNRRKRHFTQQEVASGIAEHWQLFRTVVNATGYMLSIKTIVKYGTSSSSSLSSTNFIATQVLKQNFRPQGTVELRAQSPVKWHLSQFFLLTLISTSDKKALARIFNPVEHHRRQYIRWNSVPAAEYGGKHTWRH